MRVKCHLCRHWDERLMAYEYHMANATKWKPPQGYDPRLREFKCTECGGVFYQLLNDKRLATELREERPAHC